MAGTGLVGGTKGAPAEACVLRCTLGSPGPPLHFCGRVEGKGTEDPGTVETLHHRTAGPALAGEYVRLAGGIHNAWPVRPRRNHCQAVDHHRDTSARPRRHITLPVGVEPPARLGPV